MKNGTSYLFLMNHTDAELRTESGSAGMTDLLTGSQVSGTAAVPAKGVMILKG
ncbi:beta-galactosidase [Paenibacillus forsythiae]|uniref:Beta-galactosidase n=1 Tax=Paenibacillus forsythiae TaxID=365616 RepID=A0ABU3H8F2_9BACL|nr:Beta-galactosidase C-terminal domain [Paenibacillus forsythiae]MDT3427084.1 beta-galactosidase [Paenibacillus forsythiae]